ncbi:phage late control D family protein [Bosea sp. (in: a-proteobacteria)]
MAWAMPWRVVIGGREMTDRWNPVLTSIETTDKAGASSDTAELGFDNTDGQVLFPEKGTPIQVYLAHLLTFDGFTDEPRSSGARGQGRVFSLSCKGFDPKGKSKQRLDFHKDDVSLKEFLEDAAKRAGLKGIKIDATLGAIRRDYWAAGGRSFLHLGQVLAEELGATFKVRGDQAAFVRRGNGLAASGTALPTIRAVWGDNLIAWDISPNLGRPQHGRARLRWFDRKAARFKEEDVEVRSGDDAPQAMDLGRFEASDQASAKDGAAAKKTKADRDGGAGTVRIDCDPSAQAEGTLILDGADPGVDGTYRMESVRHALTRSGGSETTCAVKQPTGTAGKDSRKPKAGSANPSAS